MGASRVLLLALAALATTAVAGQDATAWPVATANATNTHTISHVVPPQASEEPSAGFPSHDSSASADLTTTPAPAVSSPAPSHAPVEDGSGTGSGSGAHGNSSASGSRHDGPDVGDVDKNAAVVVPDVVAKPTFVPVPTLTPAEEQKQKELEAQAAQAKQAREVAGGQGAGMQAFTIGVGVAGVAAVAVIAVYMQKRRLDNERPTVAITSADARDSTPSVYTDPLGTRFSSIVMITPNGDGVCIL